ncbi:MAG: pimeloyl-ACP methyl ester esterase BioH [Casimicrobiaceae bacterium]|jgi:pimeloyl-[acyl-carrier protein] methyl ester esterase
MTLHVASVGEGPPLVLVHGFAMHGGLFAPIVHALAQRHRVHVVDLPGHGYSVATEGNSIAAVADSVMTSLGSATPATFVGWSYGGLLAQHIALTRPDAVAALVQVCTSPRFVAGPDWPHAMSAETLTRFGDELRVSYRLTLQRFLTLQVQGSEAGRATLGSLRHALFARNAPSPATLAGALEVLMEADMRGVVAQITAPTLVVTGSNDALTPAAAGAWLARAIPNARHVDIEGAAHAPFLSHRDAFLSNVRAFLDEHTEFSRA